jgi:kexin
MTYSNFRPDLSWRDIQHLCVQSAVPLNLDDPDWETMASGRKFSYKYGFGKLDAYAFVTMARTWTNVKPQAWVNVPTIELVDARMEDGEMLGGEPIAPGGVRSTSAITWEMLQDGNFDKLEHITVKVWISHTRRGDVEVSLLSPAGVKSVLATARTLDSANTGFVGWTFMTLKHWYVTLQTLGRIANSWQGREPSRRLDPGSVGPKQ